MIALFFDVPVGIDIIPCFGSKKRAIETVHGAMLMS